MARVKRVRVLSLPVIALIAVVCLIIVYQRSEHRASVRSRQAISSLEIDGLSEELHDPTDRLRSLLPMPGSKHIEEALATLELKKRVPPIRWQEERVENVTSEGIDQLIANLANFDDYLFAASSSGLPNSRGRPESDSYIVSHLYRVRKLLKIAESEPEIVASKLKNTLLAVFQDWPSAYRDELELHLRPSLSKGEPTERDKLRTRALAAVYVLAETHRYESLPLLVECHRVQSRWINEIPYRYISHTPIAPAIHLYAMHRLVSTFPQEKLTPDVRLVHGRYMKWANENLPPPKGYLGVEASSLYDESDVRNIFLDPEGRLVRDEPKQELFEYPWAFSDREGFHREPDTSLPYPAPRAITWGKMIEEFTQSAFPDAASHPRVSAPSLK